MNSRADRELRRVGRLCCLARVGALVWLWQLSRVPSFTRPPHFPGVRVRKLQCSLVPGGMSGCRLYLLLGLVGSQCGPFLTRHLPSTPLANILKVWE